MKLQVTQENLNRALSTVARVANTRSTLPILANILIRTSNNRLSISATNLDIAITSNIGAKISQEGSITVPARLMQDFINSLPAGVIDLDLQDNKLHISTGKYNSTINGIIADDFPVMPAISDKNKWSIPTTDFKPALQQVVLAASSDETRPVLTGILIYSENDKLFMAATDSYRLAEKEISTTKQDVNILVPASSMQELLRVISDDEKNIIVFCDDQQVKFISGDTELISRLIDGKYPDYKKLIPTKFEHQATLQKSELLSVTKVSSLFARENAGSVNIVLDKNTKTLSIKSVASQLGENTAEATAKITADGSITLNSKYLLDALSVIQGEEIVFGFNGKVEPTILRGVGHDDYLHVIMPLKS